MTNEEFKATARRLAVHCAEYKGADTAQSISQLAITTVPFLVLTSMALMLVVNEIYWAGLLLTIPAGGFLVRMFIIQHDCGHGSFFRTRGANTFVGRLMSVFTLTPYTFWMEAHAMHHATSGNLTKRGFGDIDTKTVAEYEALTPLKKLAYRTYRNPLVWLLIGSPYHFIIDQRFPFAQPFPFAKIWRSILLTNVALVLVHGSLIWLVGFQTYIMVMLPISCVAIWAGGWLFYIQHQFADTHWEADKEWDFHSAAILGSSYYVLPGVLNWITGSIGIHHIHHLCGSIPFYRLKECLNASPELKGMCRMTIRDSLKSIRLSLWDEKSRQLVGFSDLKPASA
ncbi:MAG: fatty acid desaturase [Rhodospirillaceae bacterium]|nr:fatty acid desaturase [Rhodospirillaceae bacterium]